MAILAIIAVIALGGYAYGFIKTRELSALRKEMKLYVDRMEAAELDLHAIRSVAEHRLHGAGKQFADLYSRIDGATGGRLREKIDVFPGDRRSRLISSMTSVAPA
ncbi:hypothetical protein [Escherichia coli]|uniref:hypothetical protein n=2 Tax=Escherichia coli TaxID=562 RepID=UPI001022910F|nr:hypothetical protein [Escherichia coli]